MNRQVIINKTRTILLEKPLLENKGSKKLFKNIARSKEKITIEPDFQSRKVLLERKVIDSEIPEIVIDECIACSKLIRGLTKIGYQVTFLGQGVPDSQILSYVKTNNAVLISQDNELETSLYWNKSLLIENEYSPRDNLRIIESWMMQFICDDLLKARELNPHFSESVKLK